MRTTLKMPRVGENVKEVVIVELRAIIGQEIHEGQILVTVETDKATVEVPSPISGTLVEYLVKSDAEIAVGEPFAILNT